MAENGWTAIILAGGKGTRMKSPLPKVLHPVAGQPMIHYGILAAKEAGVGEVRVVTGFGSDLVNRVIEPLGAVTFHQAEQLGTGDAVRAAKPEDLKGFVMIFNGDHPLIKSEDLKKMMVEFEESSNALTVVSAKVKDPGSLGRIVRSGDQLEAIVEAKDASASTLKINEINAAIYFTRAEVLNKYLPMIGNHNANNEYYFTDIVGICREEREPVGAIVGPRSLAFGVNSQIELAKASKVAFKRKINSLLEDGVVVVDPSNTYVEPHVQVGAGSVIYPGAYLRGRTRIGNFCAIEPNSYISDSEIGDSTMIRVGSHLERAVVHSKCTVGPYARLRPQSLLEDEVQIGNFVELKKTTMKKGAKAGHLAYLGDAEVGSLTNIGCGTITCNYAVDKKKYKTEIGDNVFVGSDTQFVAPVKVGDNAVIASGSTITKDVPDDGLGIARGRQITKENRGVNYYRAKASESEEKESTGRMSESEA